METFAAACTNGGRADKLAVALIDPNGCSLKSENEGFLVFWEHRWLLFDWMRPEVT